MYLFDMGVGCGVGIGFDGIYAFVLNALRDFGWVGGASLVL